MTKLAAKLSESQASKTWMSVPYARRIQKLVFLHVYTELSGKDLYSPSEQTQIHMHQ